MTGRLHVVNWSQDGPPLVLLHGLGGAASTWTLVAQRLSRHFHVLAPDLLGFGRSPWPRIAYTLEDYLVALERVLLDGDLGEGPFDIAGYSMGAILAAELAARQPERVRELVLVSLPYFRSEIEARQRVGKLGLLARLTADGHWAGAAACRLMCTLRPVLRAVLPSARPDIPPDVARDGVMHNWPSYSQSLRNLILRHRPDAALVSLAHRAVTLIHGDADATAPLDNIRDLAARFPAWRLEVVGGAGHHLPFEQPAVLAELLDVAFAPSLRV